MSIRAAAEDTVRFSRTLPDRDSASLEQLCGYRRARDLAERRAAGRARRRRPSPCAPRLRGDRATASVMRLLEATDGAGPEAAAAARRAAPPRRPRARADERHGDASRTAST